MAKTINKKRVPKGIKRFALFNWFLLLITSIIFLYGFYRFGIFPLLWLIVLTLIIVILVLLLSFTTFSRYNGKLNKLLTGIVNLLMSLIMILGGISLPNVRNRVENIFEQVSGKEKVTINFYALNDEYKNNNGIHTNTSGDTIENYLTGTFITQNAIEVNNHNYALDEVKKEYQVNDLNLLEQTSIFNAVDVLMSGQGDVLVLNEALVDVLEEIDGYEYFGINTKIIHTVEKVVDIGNSLFKGNMAKEPFNIYIAGSDSRSEELTLFSRFDVNMIVTVNPKTRQILITQVPRDYYLPNPSLNNQYDKLTHMGITGATNSVQVLEKLFNQNIGNYMIANFRTFKVIVDAIGGIDINNPYYFESHHEGNHHYFNQGLIHLDGEAALGYVRERKSLPLNDLSRGEHQMLVLSAIIDKMTSFEVISHFNQLLTSLEGTFLTNIETEQFFNLVRLQLNDMSSWNIVKYRLGGTGNFETCASTGDVSLYVYYPVVEDVNYVKEEMNKVINGDTITQGVLPSN